MQKIKTYSQETQDGVADLVVNSNSIAYCIQATISKNELASADVVEKVLAKGNPDQIDLYYLESVLVSTGWNKNDDVFEPQVAWAARHTPEDKQFNFMHDENDIIGHITGSYILDSQGNKLVAGNTEPPKQFDIITEAVLYNSWSEPENRERMQQLIAEIEEGQWFVSMECLFSDFDYALIDPDGKSQVVKRGESSAFLTKHLRVYGGSGEYEGYKVGRALRNISFSGKGLVSKPANPRSIIFNSSKAFLVNESDILTNISIGDVNMSDNQNLLEKQVADLQAELDTAKEENKAMKQNIEEAKDKEFAATIEAFEEASEQDAQAIAGLEETIKMTQVSIAELEDALAQKNEELTEAVQAVAQMENKEKMLKRLASLVDAGFSAEQAEESLALYDALDDEAFEAIVAKWSTKKDAEAQASDESDEAEETESQETDAVEAEETEDEVSEEIFDEVESTEATLVEAVEDQDELQSTRAEVAEWLSENVLNK